MSDEIITRAPDKFVGPVVIEGGPGFGLFGTRGGDGYSEQINWSPSRDLMEAVIKTGFYQQQGWSDLEIRESFGQDTDQAKSLQGARENAAKGRPLKRRRKQEQVKRAAAMPDTRFVSWAEFKQAAETAGIGDTDPVAGIHCTFPIDLEGEPPLNIYRDDLGIVAINYAPQTFDENGPTSKHPA